MRTVHWSVGAGAVLHCSKFLGQRCERLLENTAYVVGLRRGRMPPLAARCSSSGSVHFLPVGRATVDSKHATGRQLYRPHGVHVRDDARDIGVGLMASAQLKRNWNVTETKLKQNSFKTVLFSAKTALKRFSCFSQNHIRYPRYDEAQ